MKQVLILLGLILCMCSCTYMNTVYEYTITYTIEDNVITEVHRIDMPSVYVPAYRLDKNSLQIVGLDKCSNILSYTTIYKGSLNVKVINFDYKVIRTYEASSWDGHEIKKK